MAPPIRPVGNPEAASREVREAIAARKAQKRKAWARGGIAAAAILGPPIVAVGIAIHRDNPRTWETRNPVMVQAAHARDFHGYDHAAIETYPGLKKVSPVILKHWDDITNIAGNTYNTLTVIDTLSRVPGSANGVDTSLKINQWAGNPRMDRRADIIGKASALPNADVLFKDLFGLPSSRIEDARRVFYGDGNWKYGALRSGTHMQTNAVPKNAMFRELDRQSQIIKAKARK